MSDITSNFQATNPNNVLLPGINHFYQTTLFLGEGKFHVGNNVVFGYQFAPHFYGFHNLLVAEFPESIIVIGEGTSFSNDVSIRALGKIVIGKNCLIGDRVTIYDSDFHEISPEFRRRSPGKIEPVIIENNVWIGSQVTILKGVKIGKNAVIAAGSVVINDVQENTVVGGNPARFIKDI